VTSGRSVGTLVSSTNKTDRHHIIVILLKVALNTIPYHLNYPFNKVNSVYGIRDHKLKSALFAMEIDRFTFRKKDERGKY
jgi:hypothetical protein